MNNIPVAIIVVRINSLGSVKKSNIINYVDKFEFFQQEYQQFLAV